MALLSFGNITLKQHINSGDEFLVGEITDWGRILPAPAVDTATFSDQPHSLKSLAIGPESDIDQVVLRYALPAKVGITSTGGAKNIGQRSESVRMSITAPFNSAIRDGITSGPLVLNPGPLLQLSPVDRFVNTYWAEGQAVPQPFGIAMNLPNIKAVWDKQPLLQIVLSGANTRLPATWGRRNIKFATYYNADWFDAMGLNNEGVYKAWPIHGRKKVTVRCRSQGNGTFRVRLSTVGGWPSSADLGIESQVAPGGYPTTVPIPINAQAKFDLQLVDRATYLIVYAARTGPAVPLATDNLFLDLSASDD